KLTFKHITDGLSNVPFIGEKWVPEGYFGTATAHDTSIYNADSRTGVGRSGGQDQLLTPDSQVVENAGAVTQYNKHFGGPHTAGVFFVFGDGRVRSVSYQTDWLPLKYIMNRSDGEVLPNLD